MIGFPILGQRISTFAFSGREDQLIDCKSSVSRLSLEHEAEVGGGADLYLAGRPFWPSGVETFGRQDPFLQRIYLAIELK